MLSRAGETPVGFVLGGEDGGGGGSPFPEVGRDVGAFSLPFMGRVVAKRPGGEV